MAPGKTALIAGVAVVLMATVTLPVLGLIVMFDQPDLGFGPTIDPTGIGSVPAQAYDQAALAARDFTPACEVPSWLLAGVGEIESGHGTYGGATVTSNGDVRPPIIGIPLPALGPDTDGGQWDGSVEVDHAVGPMQFIPATWRTFGLDGNDDGVADPHNVYDAALTAAAYLCHEASPMATNAQWRQGLLAYNHSGAYVEEVLAAGREYQVSAPQSTAGDGEMVEVSGIGLTNPSWAHQVRALLAAAAADGLILTGGSYRDPAEQIELRRQHCGESHEAIYDWPSSSCSPPTARPGESLHEVGLAIDFDRCSTTSTDCWRWLNANASSFGLRPLSSEPWHWSVDGR